MAALFVPAANTRQGSKSRGPRLIHLSRRPLHRAAGDAFSPVFVTGRHNAVAYDLGLGIEPVDVEAEGFLPSQRTVVGSEAHRDHDPVRRGIRPLAAGVAQGERTDPRERDRLSSRRIGKPETLLADRLPDPRVRGSPTRPRPPGGKSCTFSFYAKRPQGRRDSGPARRSYLTVTPLK